MASVLLLCVLSMPSCILGPRRVRGSVCLLSSRLRDHLARTAYLATWGLSICWSTFHRPVLHLGDTWADSRHVHPCNWCAVATWAPESSWAGVAILCCTSQRLSKTGWLQSVNCPLSHVLQAKKHLGPKLLQTAAEMGIDIRPVLVGKPLREQGPFDILLHKVRRKGERCSRLNAARPWPGLAHSSPARACCVHEACSGSAAGCP